MNTTINRRLSGIAGLLALLGVLLLAGQTLATPPFSFGRWLAWWSGVDPLVAGASTMRMAATCLCLWLLLVTLLDSLALAVRAVSVQRVTSALAPACWRVLVLKPAMVVAVTVPQIALPLTSLSPASSQTIDVDEPTHREDDDGTQLPILTMSRQANAAEAPSITMRRHVVPGPTTISADEHRHVVQPGENLWSIAAVYLSAQRGERPTSSEVTTYWHALIEINRSVLPDPDNPDLLYRGIELTMPPAP